jgi:hypothetical protein
MIRVVNKQMKNVSKILFAIVLASILTTVVVAVTPLFSNTVITQINPTVSVALVTDKTSYTVGDTVTLTATLAPGMTDREVTFYLNNVALGSVASLNRVATYTTTAANSGLTIIDASWNASVIP